MERETPSSHPRAPLRPTSSAERIDALDAMRGLAILGVLLAYTVWSLGSPPEETWTRADRAVAWAMDTFVDNKFLSMFAFLFGMGIAQQWRRWETAGFDPVPLHLRRMGFLMGIGLLHAVLLRNGDILVPYALLGLALLASRAASTRTIAIAVPLLFVTPFVVETVRQRMGWSWPPRPGAVGGGYLAENLAWLRYWYRTNPFLGWPRIFSLVLLGRLAGRTQIIERAAKDRGLAGRALAWALSLALATRLARGGLLKLWGAPPMPGTLRSFTAIGLYELNSWAMAASYIATVLLTLQWESWARYLWPLRAVGRMAFTNYLMQGLLIVPLCLLFGWFDKVTPGRGLLLAGGVAILQLVFSAWWLRRHAAGPFERLWRRVTYGS